jgi:hypothetical protein
MEHRWAVTTATGEFVYGHVEPTDVVPGLSPGQERVVLLRQPEPGVEKYSGNPADPFTPKTSAEKAAYIDTKRNEVIDGLLNDVTFRVLGKWIARLHGLSVAQAKQQLRPIVKAIMIADATPPTPDP